MITKEQAVSLPYRATLYCLTRTNADGTPMRARVNGRAQTWVRRPDDFRLPMKHGLRNTFQITPDNASHWTIDEKEAIAAK